MNKFGVEDIVECVYSETAGYEGCGWKFGYRFKITEISETAEGRFCYWKGNNNSGVYEPYLKLITAVELKIGDKVKVIKRSTGKCNAKWSKYDCCQGFLGLVGTVVSVREDKIGVNNFNKENIGWCSSFSRDCLRKMEDSKMSEYEEIKQKIENLVAWDKDADDIILQLNRAKGSCSSIAIQQDNTSGYGTIKVGFKHFEYDQEFVYSNQCNKLATFKTALLWLLDHSGIKNKKQTEIDELKKEAKKLNERIEKLEKE